MRTTMAVSICLLLACLGCGTFKDQFNQSFDKSFRQSCRDGAIKRGAEPKIAEKYCECALEKFKETKSMDEASKACVAQIRSGLNQ